MERPNFPEAAGVNMNAIQYGNRVADKVLKGTESVTAKIVELFRSGLNSYEIADSLNGELPVAADVTKETRSSIIRRILNVLVPEEERKEAAREQYRKTLQNKDHGRHRRRNEWMQRNGMFVWSPEEHDYLLELSQREDMKRTPVRLNQVKIAAAMNERFESTAFTPDMCREHLSCHKYQQNRSARERKAAAAHENGERNGTEE